MLDIEAIKARLDELQAADAACVKEPWDVVAYRRWFDVYGEVRRRVAEDERFLLAEVERLRTENVQACDSCDGLTKVLRDRQPPPAVLLLYGEPFESHECEIVDQPPGSLIVRCKALETEVERTKAEAATIKEPHKFWLLEVQFSANHPTHRFLYQSEEAARKTYDTLPDFYSRNLVPIFVEQP